MAKTIDITDSYGTKATVGELSGELLLKHLRNHREHRFDLTITVREYGTKKKVKLSFDKTRLSEAIKSIEDQTSSP